MGEEKFGFLKEVLGDESDLFKDLERDIDKDIDLMNLNPLNFGKVGEKKYKAGDQNDPFKEIMQGLYF